jgi:hypothetical protein
MKITVAPEPFSAEKRSYYLSVFQIASFLPIGIFLPTNPRRHAHDQTKLHAPNHIGNFGGWYGGKYRLEQYCDGR